jgi:hypothetical protein
MAPGRGDGSYGKVLHRRVPQFDLDERSISKLLEDIPVGQHGEPQALDGRRSYGIDTAGVDPAVHALALQCAVDN